LIQGEGELKTIVFLFSADFYSRENYYGKLGLDPLTRGNGMTHSKHSGQPHHSEKKPTRKGLHKDWRAWLALGLMLAAMGIYVLTLDDSVQPDSAAGSAAPAQTAGPPK